MASTKILPRDLKYITVPLFKIIVVTWLSPLIAHVQKMGIVIANLEWLSEYRMRSPQCPLFYIPSVATLSKGGHY